MYFRIDPDKRRFVDLKARENDALVHTVEVSDERSLENFITLFFKGRLPETDSFVYLTGLREDNHHDPKIYHRDDEKTSWVNETFGDKAPAWTFHWHKRLKKAPTLADLEPFKEGIPSNIWRELEKHFATARKIQTTKKGFEF